MPSAATSSSASSSRPRRRWPSRGSASPTCWRARAGIRAWWGSWPAGSPSATTARRCSVRSIPAFDLLAGLDACARHLLRHGGHRAAAGLEIAAGAIDEFRAAFEAYADSVLAPEDLVPVERVDAVAAGGDLGHALAEELEALAPFGHGNPPVALLVPAARLTDP